MNQFKILSKGEKAEIESELKKRFGIEKVPEIIDKRRKEIYASLDNSDKSCKSKSSTLTV